MYHSFCIHSSVDGHLGCFHVLALINGAAMNTGVHVSFWFSFGFLRVYAAMNTGVHVSFWFSLVSSGFMPSSEIVGSYGGLFLGFKRISILSSIVAVSIYIPTNSARRFPFLHTLSSFYCL